MEEGSDKKGDGQEAAGKEMLTYRDGFTGESYEFPKPPTPDILDLLETERYGTDNEEIYVSDDEEEEDAEEAAAAPAAAAEEEGEMTKEKMLERAREKERRRLEAERRRRIKRLKKKEQALLRRMKSEMFETWNFPRDPDNWTEEDLGEEWVEAPKGSRDTGYDPEYPELKEAELKDLIAEERKRKRERAQAIRRLKKKLQNEKETSAQESKPEEEPMHNGVPVRPYYLPYRRKYPMIPRNHPEVECAADVVDELEKIEEFLKWGSYYFEDGSTYEGTLWDDLAHGRGVYTTPFDLCKYEGEWFQNMMQGHGTLHVNVPIYEPCPGSKRESQMRAKGHILATNFMSEEEREWLKKDLEDMSANPEALLDEPQYEDSPLWIEYYGSLPEKGRYKYSGQWKHNRMHGCGVYEVNTRVAYGKFYFGDLLPELGECTLEACAFHAGLAEVAAGKAKMFTKKPDGMVREMDGPFNDPQHPYFYEEEDMWMAPGWINAFYKVPDKWKRYVEEVDKEQEMWLNSFIKAPLRLPGQAEAEYMWEEGNEFILLGPNPSLFDRFDEKRMEIMSNPELQGEILYHVPTGTLINWIVDKDGNVRLFRQPIKNDGSVVPEEIEFLPEGWDAYFDEAVKEDPKKRRAREREERLRKAKEQDEKDMEKWRQDWKAMKQKWKEEDEELWEELRLIGQAAEEEAAAEEEYEREMAAMDAARRAAGEVTGSKAEEAVEEDEEEAKEEAKEDEEEANEEEEKQKPSFGKINEDKPDEKRDEDEEDEDDDKKPRSFGSVASSDSGRTAWASITMSLLPRGFVRMKERILSAKKVQKTGGLCSSDHKQVHKQEAQEQQVLVAPAAVEAKFAVPSLSRRCKSVRLKAWRGSEQHLGGVVQRLRCRRRRKQVWEEQVRKHQREVWSSEVVLSLALPLER